MKNDDKSELKDVSVCTSSFLADHLAFREVATTQPITYHGIISQRPGFSGLWGGLL